MKVEALRFSENALLAIEMLRKSVMEIEKPDIEIDGSVEELVMLLDIAAHSSSNDVIEAAQQVLGFSNPGQVSFFKTVGVKLEYILSSRVHKKNYRGVTVGRERKTLHSSGTESEAKKKKITYRGQTKWV